MKLLLKLKQRASRLKRELHALWLAYGDPRTPWAVRLLIVCIIAYALSPINLIPDPIPIIGHLDDLILLPIGMALTIRMIPSPVMADCRKRARQTTFHEPANWKWIGIAFVLFVSLLAPLFVWRFIRLWTWE
jgi:uncharacterized membrane protein YkvA (DUF1232 family)